MAEFGVSDTAISIYFMFLNVPTRQCLENFRFGEGLREISHVSPWEAVLRNSSCRPPFPNAFPSSPLTTHHHFSDYGLIEIYS